MISINLVLVDQKTIRRLNKKYRQADKPTTVLSFNYGQVNFPLVPGEVKCLGEIVICPGEAKKQNLSIENLVVHGLQSLLSEVSTTENCRT